MLFQIFKDNVVIYYDDGSISAIIPTESFIIHEHDNFFSSKYGKLITRLVNTTITTAENDIRLYKSSTMADYGYVHWCLGCDKMDYVVQGFCKSCFDQLGLKYEYER